jgi:hypothetical protein
MTRHPDVLQGRWRSPARRDDCWCVAAAVPTMPGFVQARRSPAWPRAGSRARGRPYPHIDDRRDDEQT